MRASSCSSDVLALACGAGARLFGEFEGRFRVHRALAEPLGSHLIVDRLAGEEAGGVGSTAVDRPPSVDEDRAIGRGIPELRSLKLVTAVTVTSSGIRAAKRSARAARAGSTRSTVTIVANRSPM